MPERMFTEKSDVANVHVAGEGSFFGVSIHPEATTGGVVSTVIDEVRVTQFVLPIRATVNRIATELVVVGGASTLYGVALYDRGKNLLLETGALDANTTQFLETTITPISLLPGIYWLAATSDSTTAQLKALNIANILTFHRDTTTRRAGTAANAAPTPGTFPATLGTIATGVLNPPAALFYPE